ncbi:MAG: hypothetical protein JEZ02_17505 [Desulfatibacillum sp.]|nr:hypothetical protein [Desulfatibacillum sp.]
MKNQLQDVFKHIGAEYAGEILRDSGYLLEVDVSGKADKLGYGDVAEKYRGVSAFVPLKNSAPGMKVMFDGRGFSRYAQFESGVVAPEHVARDADLPHKDFEPHDSMVRIIG